MQITKCDRCGNIFDRPRKEGQITNHMKLYYIATDGITYCSKGTYDICPDCAKDLMYWLEEKKEAE